MDAVWRHYAGMHGHPKIVCVKYGLALDLATGHPLLDWSALQSKLLTSSSSSARPALPNIVLGKYDYTVRTVSSVVQLLLP
jgi:hypothetical protein